MVYTAGCFHHALVSDYCLITSSLLSFVSEEYLKVFSYTTAGELLFLACVILVGLFALQHCGTHRVAFMFAPIVIIWLISILFIGLYNIIHWNPKIIHAISPLYIIKFFRVTGQDGWISLAGVLLSVTGSSGSRSRHKDKTISFLFALNPVFFRPWNEWLMSLVR